MGAVQLVTTARVLWPGGHGDCPWVALGPLRGTARRPMLSGVPKVHLLKEWMPADPVPELWDAYHRAPGRPTRDPLIVHYSPLVKYVAGRVAVAVEVETPGDAGGCAAATFSR